MNASTWRKSSYSTDEANCVEVALAPVVQVRDTKDREGGVLALDREAWSRFLRDLKS